MATDPEGRKVVAMQERVRRPTAPLGEVGRTGTQVFHGFITTEEYVPELMGLTGLRTLDKMRRSDGMTKAVLRALIQPLMSATWQVEPASEDERDVAIAGEIEDGLFDGMSGGWKDALRQVFTFLPLGFSIFEVVWEVRDVDGEQKFMVRKLAPRLQRTIYRFNVADDGGLDSVTQTTYAATGYLNIDIDIDRLLVFVNEKEGGNWEGQSILRSAYKHWWIKDNLYRIQAMAAERWGVGIPMVFLPADHSEDEDMRKAENILSALRGHERGYAAWPFGYDFKLITSSSGGGTVMDLLPMITHHDRMIAVSVLAQFLVLGSTDVGSWALSSDQSALFLMVEQSLGDYVCDILNRHLIPKWVDYNYSGVKAYPKLIVTNIETRNMEKLLVGLAAAAQAGLVTHDPDLEDAIRDGLGFPSIPRDEQGNPIGSETGPLPPGVVDTAAGLGSDGVQSGAVTNPAEPKGTGAASPPALNRRKDRKRRRPSVYAKPADGSGSSTSDEEENAEPPTGAMIPNLSLATSYESENAQIAHNAATPDGQAPHEFRPARYTHTNGHPRCLLCGSEPMQGDPAHTAYPKNVMAFAFAPRRPLRPAEEHVDFEALDRVLDESRAKVKDASATPVQRLIRLLAERATRAVRSGDASQLSADALALDASDLQAAIKGELDDLYRFGATQVRDELRKQIVSLRGSQAAALGREAAVAETYARTFEELREAIADGNKDAFKSLAKVVEGLSARPIVLNTIGGKVSWKTKINPETGVIEGLERVEE